MKQDTENTLYTLGRILEHISADTSAKLSNAIDGAFEDTEKMEARFRILSMFDDAILVVSHLTLPEPRVERMIEMLNGHKGRFLRACLAPTVSEFIKNLGGPATINDINLAGDAVASAAIDETQPIDRGKLRADTDALIENLLEVDLPQMEREALIIKLQAFSRILTECRGLSDDALRRRIKSIYADFCAEFEANDKKYRSAREAIFTWARSAMKYGVVGMALLADGAAVAGYITDASSTLSITDQSE